MVPRQEMDGGKKTEVGAGGNDGKGENLDGIAWDGGTDVGVGRGGRAGVDFVAVLDGCHGGWCCPPQPMP